MSSENPKRSLAVLDVGHGSAAVLCDEGGVVVFDTGRGPQVDYHLRSIGAQEVEAVFLSHADGDHIGGAITLLMNKNLRIGHVFLNPDPTKDTQTFQQLRYALAEAENIAGTKVVPSLTTSTQFPRAGASIEVLYPPASSALGGVGGRDLGGNPLTSNSLSAAIRVTGAPESSVLLGGDIGYECINHWKRYSVTPSARAMVFPHHGGLPSQGNGGDAALFAYELSTMVKPETVIFSVHRTQYSLPRDEILSAVLSALSDVRFVCTQLPERFHAAVQRDGAWALHMGTPAGDYLEGNIEIEFSNRTLSLHFF